MEFNNFPCKCGSEDYVRISEVEVWCPHCGCMRGTKWDGTIFYRVPDRSFVPIWVHLLLWPLGIAVGFAIGWEVLGW